MRTAPELRLSDVAFTLAAGRTGFAHRAALRARSKEHLIEELDLLAQGDEDCGFVRGVMEMGAPRVAFLFAGQGGERTGMGLSLLRQSEVFLGLWRRWMLRCAGVIARSVEEIFRRAMKLSESAYVQPALFAFQYGLARLWQSWD